MPVLPPNCQALLGPAFLKALVCASKFLGTGGEYFPWTQHVHLVGGKLYASDNRCIVEIDVGDVSIGPARFSADDISTLMVVGEGPHRAVFSATETAFAWEDGCWLSIDTDLTGSEFVNRSRSLLDQFWHEGRPLPPHLRSTVVSLKAADDVRVCFPRKFIGEPTDHEWHYGAISKVVRTAKTYDPDATPTPFSFPMGRGLVVNPSGQSGPFTEAFFYHPEGASLIDASWRLAEGRLDAHLDDLPAMALLDTKDAYWSNRKLKGGMLSRRRGRPDALAVLDRAAAELAIHFARQHEAIAKYQKGETLDASDRDLIMPKAASLLKRLKKDVERTEEKNVEEGAPKKKPKLDIKAEVAEKHIATAFSRYFEPEFKREHRVQYWNRLGSLSVTDWTRK